MNVAAAMTALALLAMFAVGCGKEAPKADAAAQQREALERAKEGAFGTPVKALESAKTMGADLDQKARASVEKAEQGAK